MEGKQMTKRVGSWLNPVFWGGVLVVLATQIVYLLTMNISCPFWDSGEFIATSYTLGIPHPPGTPLYVLIGRVFTLFPFSEISARVNYLSVFGSTLTALFSYLVVVKLALRLVRHRGRNTTDSLIAIGAGMVAGFFTAFGRTFWDNAVEAEVYGLSSCIMVLAVWLALKWDESGKEGERDNNYLLLIGYLLFVSIGIHMGTFLLSPAIFLFVLLISRRTVLNQITIPLMVVALAAVLRYFGLHSGMVMFLGVTGLLWFTFMLIRHWGQYGGKHLAIWLVGLGLLGITVQLFLLIRSGLDPMINEADPSNWKNLWLVLSRDQYKPPNPFLLRQAPYDIQFTKHFWRYWHDQYHLGIRPEWLSMALPFFLGAAGAVVQAMRDRKRFYFVLSLVFFATVFLVFYLNFRENEVRDRDYFFVTGYHFFALWIGLGAAALAQWLRGEPTRAVADDGEIESDDVAVASAGPLVEPAGGKLFGVGTIAILVVLSLFPVKNGWYKHDHTDFMVARDYAYNMLTPLEEGAIIFTNGDNDTFPLWYIQEVEGVRTDVRVVNLSLLNTHWYIRQLRDYEPQLEISFADNEIDMLHGFYAPDGRVVLVKDIMVHDLINTNPGRPVYVAVTVPDLMELEPYLEMEGLVFRVTAEKGEEERINPEKTWHNLQSVFLYRGLLDEEGNYDESVYKDSNAMKLCQNYVAAYVRIAHDHLSKGRDDDALAALEYARRINPEFPGVLYTMGYLWLEREQFVKAEQVFRELIALGDKAAEVYRFLGASLEGQDRRGEAEEIYRAAISERPEDFDAHRVLFTYLWSTDKKDDAVRVIENWLVRHPDDYLTRQALEDLLNPAAQDSSSLPALDTEAPIYSDEER
jgi:tetratricopeptide (TPR) repeat protein